MKKFISICFCAVVAVQILNAQAVLSPALSPGIEWKSVTWSPLKNDWVTTQEQDHSGEDWWMDVIEYYDNGVHVGYAACGFSTWSDFLELNDYLPCVNDAYDLEAAMSATLFHTPERARGILRQTVGIFDLKGNLLHFYRYNIGTFFKIVQAENGDLIMTGDGKNVVSFIGETHMETVQMYANPDCNSIPSPSSSYSISNFPSGWCDENAPIRGLDLNVVRIDPSGNVQFNNYYNTATNLEDSFYNRGIGHGIAPTGDGGFYIIGRTQSFNYSTSTLGTLVPFIAKIDGSGGLCWRTTRPALTTGQYFWIDKFEDKYVLAGSYDIGGLFAFMEFIDLDGTTDQVAFNNPVWEKHSTSAEGFGAFGFNFDSQLGGRNHSSKSVTFTKDGDIIWPVMANNSHGFWSGPNICEGKIFIFNQAGNIISPGNAPIEVGELRAYDIYFSAIGTEDGGFATVSTRHSPQYFGTSNLPSYSDPIIGPCLDQINTELQAFPNKQVNWNTLGGYFEHWSTCAYVMKFNNQFEFEWDKIWDSMDNGPRECLPGNLKQQECLYRIVQTSDGGYIICGNTSDNLDDNYLVKITNDCAIRDFIAGINPDGSLNDNDIITDLTDGIFEINSTTTWNTNKKVLGKVLVKSGNTLTIENTEVGFSTFNTIPGGIQIEQGAKVIVNNAKLTNSAYHEDACPHNWYGIEVYGTTSQRQFPVGGSYIHQGQLIVRNDSEISYANNAIANWKNQDWDARGGIVQVSNSQFLNNRRSAEFIKYENTNSIGLVTNDLSYFNNCVFDRNDDYLRDVYTTEAHTTLWAVHGVAFKGCSFNSSFTTENAPQQNSGLKSHNSYITINEYCPVIPQVGQPCPVTPTPSSFTGFYKGIEAIADASTKIIDVRNSIFDENLYGIEMRVVDRAVVQHNDFAIGELQHEPIENELNIGLFAFQSTGFSIEQNRLYKSGEEEWNTHGIVVQQSGAAENEVYLNQLEGLAFGSVALDGNKNSSGTQGLQFLCGQNTDNVRDHDVSSTIQDLQIKGIRHSQGDFPLVAAGNTFSQNSTGFMHYAMGPEIAPIGYLYFSGDPLQMPSSTEVTSNVLLFSSTEERTCAPRKISGHTKMMRMAEFNEASNDYYSLVYNYHQLIDGGDTQGILNEIAQSWSQDAWDLRNSLLAGSPYLSEEVLIAAADRNIMPHAMLMEVLLANPDALRSNTLIYHLQYVMTNPLPQYMIDVLIAERNKISAKTALLGAIGVKSEQMAVLHKIVLQDMLTDTLGIQSDSVLWFMARLENIPTLYSLAMAHLEMGDADDGEDVLDFIPVLFPKMNVQEIEELNQMKALYAIHRSVKEDSRDEARMTPAEVEQYLIIAETPYSGRAGAQAWNTLCFFYNMCPDAEGQLEERSYHAYSQPYGISKNTLNNPVTVYPNPANQYTTLSYELFSAHPQTILRLTDINGRQITTFTIGENYQGQQLWDTREVKPGVYIYQLVQNNKQVASGKIIVQH